MKNLQLGLPGSFVPKFSVATVLKKLEPPMLFILLLAVYGFGPR